MKSTNPSDHIPFEYWDEPIIDNPVFNKMLEGRIGGKLIVMPKLRSDWIKRYYDEYLKGCSGELGND